MKWMCSFSCLVIILSCGGSGGDGGKKPAEFDAIPAPTCPSGYKSVIIDNNIPVGIKTTLVSGNAQLILSRPTAASTLAVQVCFGKLSQSISQQGFYILSDVYEIQGSPLNMSSSGIENLNRELIINFSMSGLPEGVSLGDKVNKIKVFFIDKNGAFQPAVVGGSSLDFANASAPASSISCGPNASGKYVVAYQP